MNCITINSLKSLSFEKDDDQFRSSSLQDRPFPIEIGQSLYVMLNPLQNQRVQERETGISSQNYEHKEKNITQGVKKLRKHYNMVGKVGSKFQHTAIPPANPTRIRDKAVNNCLGSDSAETSAHAGYKVTNVETYDEEEILSRIIRLESESCREPNLLDLLCRFSHAELDAVRNEIRWLHPKIFAVEKTAVPMVVA